MRLFMSLTEEEVKQFDKACDKAGMTRSQYLKCLLNGRRDIRPPVLQYREMIHALESIERDLKVIAMKDDLSDTDRLLIMQKLSDLKEMLSGRFHKEVSDGNRG